MSLAGAEDCAKPRAAGSAAMLAMDLRNVRRVLGMGMKWNFGAFGGVDFLLQKSLILERSQP
jgi:hypothetical protein